MKFSKTMIMVPAIFLTVLGVGIYGASRTYAQSTATGNTIVQKIADRFGLKTEDVQAVFDEERQTREQEMQATYEAMLTTAVANGELTEAKKQLILNKHAELKAQMQNKKLNFSSLTAQERQALKTEMETKHSELEQWALDNGIDIKYLRILHGGGMRGGMMHTGRVYSETQ